ncbi:MAG TPA: MFS transporter [Thermoprotei archaeon]|nr:MFS transporter [Thermoprotei archaeon]
MASQSFNIPRTRILIVVLTTLLYFLSMNISISIVVRYSRELGINISNTSIIWAVTFLVSAIFRPISGHYGDRVSSFLMMSIGSAFLMLANVVYMFSRDFTSLLLGRFLNGIASAMFVAPSIAAATLIVSEDLVGRSLSYRSATVSLGALVGPVIGGYLVDYVSYSVAFALSAALSALNAIVCALLYTRSDITAQLQRSSDRGSWKDAMNLIVILFTATSLIGGLSFFTFRSLLQSHYRDLGYPSSLYGILMACFAAITMILRLTSHRIIGSNLRRLFLISATCYFIVGLGSIVLSRTYMYPWAFIPVAFYGLGFGLLVPAVQSIISMSTMKNVRNRAMTVYAMGYDIGGFVGGIVLGHVAQTFGYSFSYAIIGLLLMINPILVLMSINRVLNK